MASRFYISVFSYVCVTLILLNSVAARSFLRIQRALPDEGSATTSKICSKSSPCGWEIYVPFTRDIVDYMPNTCTCPENTSCSRADDDLSVSAYVHRCRPKAQLSEQDENGLQNSS